MNLRSQTQSYERVKLAIKAFQQGQMVVMVDDEDRENEGDVVLPAQFVTPEAINFMAKEARGLVCLALAEAQCARLELAPMTVKNDSPHQTNFMVSIEAASGVTTGISASDRATTVLAAISEVANAKSITTPGHVFPLQAKKGGVLVRAGHTEGVVDLAQMSGLKPAGVICEIMNDDGSMARRPQLLEFAKKHRLCFLSIADLIQYRMRHESLIRCVATAKLPTQFGEFDILVFENDVDSFQHIALVKGEVKNQNNVLVRVHSECLTGDIFASIRCDCGPQLDAALQQIALLGQGVVLYIRQEGRGIGLVNKIKSYALQDQGHDTVEANTALGFAPDLRQYGIGAQVLAYLGLHKIRLLTNNPRKIVGIEGYGLEVVERVPLEMTPGTHNTDYLRTKKEKMGHLLGKV